MRPYKPRKNGGHEHRATTTNTIDPDTATERCYCGVSRMVTRNSVSGCFVPERPAHDALTLPGAEIAARHRVMMVAALAYGNLTSQQAPMLVVVEAARALERAAAQWAIGLGRVGRAAKARP